MSGHRKKENPLLKSSYSARIDTKSSLLAISKKPRANAELTTRVTEDSKRLVRLSSQLSDKPKTISTPSVKLTGTAPKLSDKYALSTKLIRKPDESSTRELTSTRRPKSEVTTKPTQPSRLKTTQLQTKSLVLSASKSGLLTSRKLTTSSLQTLSSHAASGGGSSFVSTSRAISSTRTSVKPTSLRSQPLTSKTSVKSSLQRSQLGALKDDIDGSAAVAPHYDLKLETARSNEEDETAIFLPPELDPSIQDQATPTINVLQVGISLHVVLILIFCR